MVVVDSSALIPLIKIGRISLLKKVFNKIIIPEPVWEEVITEGKRLGKPVGELENGRGKWFTVLMADKGIVVKEDNLEKNDYLVFKAAKDTNEILLTNDAALYYYALSQNFKSYWLTTLLLIATKKEKISKSEAEDILLELVNTGGLHLKSDILTELLALIKSF
ncbi:hypothetical protein HY640_04915 [Candidatus Woesearchaeota archaeon]|nr:hypothetical protein [Candidatus Woesearchaeota archaeon]